MSAFKPKNASAPSTPAVAANGEAFKFPVPKGGSRRARVSLIVDLGEQNREDIYKVNDNIVPAGTAGAEVVEQKPVQQVAVFADLVQDTVDYGGDIGKAHYRLLLNGTFKGVLKGVNFQASPPKDANNKTVEGKPWGFHPNNLLSKLAVAVGKPEIIESMDISELLNCQFMAEVEVKEVPSGKNDKDGNEIIYRNVNYKKPAMVAAIPTGEQDENGDDIEAVPEFAPLKTEAKCITFTNATKDDIKYIRKNIIAQIKLANDYAGSEMQKAIEAYEAENGGSGEPEKKAAPAPGKTAPAKAKPAPKKPIEQTEADSDVPFK